jgi:hypothetical protein
MPRRLKEAIEAVVEENRGKGVEGAPATETPPQPALQRSKSSQSASPQKRRKKQAGEDPSQGSTDAALLKAPPRIPTYRQGDRIVVKANADKAASGDRPPAGLVQYVGEVKSLGAGLWVGVLFDDPVGDSDGRVAGKRIFKCPPKHSGFFKPTDIAFERLDNGENEGGGAQGPSPPPKPIAPPVMQPGRASKAKRRPGSNADLSAASTDGAAEGGGSSSSAATPAALAGGGGAEGETSAPPPPPTAAKCCVAAGRGLHTAVVKQLAQFVITAHDADGQRRTTGGDIFSVAVRGVLPPTNLRFKVHDHGNGTYTGEYKPEVSGASRSWSVAERLLLSPCPHPQSLSMPPPTPLSDRGPPAPTSCTHLLHPPPAPTSLSISISTYISTSSLTTSLSATSVSVIVVLDEQARSRSA